MPRLRLLLLLLVVAAAPLFAQPAWIEQPDWKSEFTERGVEGCALIYDEQAGHFLVFDRARAEKPLSPASTFKLFNAMVALDTGAVKDEFDPIRWDGKKRSFPDWNRDQTLASAMKFSAVWFYQEMARRAGPERMQAFIDKAGYGNRDIGGGIDRFWLDGGALRISAAGEIAFLRALADGTLPFSARAQETVRRISIIEAAPDFILHGKTGWAVHGSPRADTDLGWVVGWVEHGGRRWFYALNIDMPGEEKDAPKRLALARALLTRVGALPAPASR